MRTNNAPKERYTAEMMRALPTTELEDLVVEWYLAVQDITASIQRVDPEQDNYENWSRSAKHARLKIQAQHDAAKMILRQRERQGELALLRRLYLEVQRMIDDANDHDEEVDVEVESMTEAVATFYREQRAAGRNTPVPVSAHAS